MSASLQFEIEKISFQQDKVLIYTSEKSPEGLLIPKPFMEKFFSIYESAKFHTCINKFGKTFEDCAHNTSLSHFFEHAVIQEMVNREKVNSEVDFVGFTKRRDMMPEHKFCSYLVTLNYVSDIDALFAIRAADKSMRICIEAC